LCNQKYLSDCGKYPSGWVKVLSERKKTGDEFDLATIPKKQFTVSLNQNTKIYHIRSYDDIVKLAHSYVFPYHYDGEGYYVKTMKTFSKLKTKILSEIDELEKEFTTEMQRIENESEASDDDVYFSCSRSVITKLYDKNLREIVFTPQCQTVKTNRKNITIDLKVPRVYEIEVIIKKKLLELDDIDMKIKSIEPSDKIDFNKLRDDGYHAIETHPELYVWYNKFYPDRHDHDSKPDVNYTSLFTYFQWLICPQLIVLNWCFETITEKPFDVDIYDVIMILNNLT
jgi:hypothetical protein